MSVNEAPAVGRIFFMSAGALANFATAVLLFILAALIGLSLPVGGLSQIVAIPAGSVFAGTDAQVGDAIERINGERFADFSAFHDALAAYSGDEDHILLDSPGDRRIVSPLPSNLILRGASAWFKCSAYWKNRRRRSPVFSPATW